MKRYSHLLVFILTCILLCACSSQSPKEETAPTPSVTSTPTPWPTATPSPSPTPLLAPDWDRKMVYYNDFAEGHKIPIVSVYTADRKAVTSREEYVQCVVDVFNCEEQFEIVEALAGIKVRGNSSAYYGDVNQILNNTVPYRIKFDSKTNVLGLNEGAECKSWVLLKTDWDLIRNHISLKLGQEIVNEGAYCSDSTLVYLYLNEDFQGIYVLCEQSQVNENRVNISEPEPEYTGTDIGYLLELDNYASSEVDGKYFIQYYAGGTVTDIQGVTRTFEAAEYSIKSDTYSQEQVDFIDQYMNNLFTVIYEACVNKVYYGLNSDGSFTDTEVTDAKELISQYVDLDSLVNMYILHEICHTYDCGEGSFYMCIDFSENSTCPKLQFTSPWDFNWGYYDSDPAWGKYYAGAFQSQSFVNQFGDRSNPWFIILMTQDWFVDMVKARWSELQTSGVLAQCMDAEVAYLEKYRDDLNVVEEWAVDCAYALLDSIETRMSWMDSVWLE